MKYRNHTLLALAIGVATNAPIPALFGISVGSVLPDRMDMMMSVGSEKLFLRAHRRFSHWPWTYVVTFIVMMLVPEILFSIPGQFIMGIAAGAALHTLGDMLTPGGIPYLPWNTQKRFGLGLFYTGSVKEYLFTWLVVLICAASIIIRFLLTGTIPLFHHQDTLTELIRYSESLIKYLEDFIG